MRSFSLNGAFKKFVSDEKHVNMLKNSLIAWKADSRKGDRQALVFTSPDNCFIKGIIMSNLPANLRYAKSHEWVLDHQDGTVSIGITDHAQEALGDVVFVELPEVGQTLSQGKEFGVIESVKAASDLYSPVNGEVIEVNEALEDSPETVNDAPYEGGWMMKVRLTDQNLDGLLDADAYQATISADD